MMQQEKLQLLSPAFVTNGMIPAEYTADGRGVNPPLFISGVSASAKSLVLIVDDPDAATDPQGSGKTYDHWVVFNIPPESTYIGENSAPARAIVGKNSAQTNTYIGPAPPTGVHRYFFRLYELSGVLALTSNATKQEVLDALASILLDTAELIGLYSR